MTPRLAAALLLVPIGLSACSGDSEPSTDDGKEPATTAEASDLLHEAVDTTLDSPSFELDYELRLSVSGNAVRLGAEGAVDYDNLIGDVRLEVEQNGQEQAIAVKADGEMLWVNSGAQTRGQWVEGDATLLAESSAFETVDLIGILYSLRAAEDVEVGEPSEVDGVDGREYTSTFSYDEAVDAAGADSEDFKSSFSLTGAAADSDLEVTVWVGDDGVVRDFDLDVVSDVVSGGADLELRNVADDVSAPDAPPDNETITGPEAQRILAQIIQ